MKLYQLTVHRTPEEEEAEAAEAALEFPRVDHMEQYRGKTSPPSLDPSEEGDEQEGAGWERRAGNHRRCVFCFLHFNQSLFVIHPGGCSATLALRSTDQNLPCSWFCGLVLRPAVFDQWSAAVFNATDAVTESLTCLCVPPQLKSRMKGWAASSSSSRCSSPCWASWCWSWSDSRSTAAGRRTSASGSTDGRNGSVDGFSGRRACANN